MSTWAPQVDEIVGQFTSATNTTLLGRADGELVVYKPVAGNRPLSDFDVATLPEREILTYRIDLELGFGLVPETAHGDGPLGPGAVQRYKTPNDRFDPTDAVRRGSDALWPMAVLDIIINNADRKLGHILEDRTGSLWGIDHGLTFHPDDKLRTVLWAFAGRPLPAQLTEAVGALPATLVAEVGHTLGAAEERALRERIDRLLEHPVHPEPPDDRPPVPWPLY